MATQQTKLSAKELADINRVEHNLSALLTDLDKAEGCGIDCDQLRNMAATMIEECQRLRNNFGT